MKRQNLIAGIVAVVAVGACALLVQFGDGPLDAPVFQPGHDLDSGTSR